MPVQKGKSALAAKYGAKLDAATKAHAKDETDYGFSRLPPGINGGVAQLRECYFDTYKTGKNQGEYYFRAMGVVIEPKEVIHNGQRIVTDGGQTSIMVPVCDTKNKDGKVTTQEEYVTKILNELRKLGVDTANATGNDLENLAAAAQQAEPFFHFSTSETPADPAKGFAARMWENWLGNKGVEDYQPSANGDVHDASPTSGGDDTAATTESSDDLDALAEQADPPNSDQASADKLQEIALAAGMSEDDFSNANSYADVVVAIRELQGSGEQTTEAEPEAFVPEKGKVCMYKAIDPKTKKPRAKGVECEITAIDKKTSTATLKNLDDGKTVYKGVKLDLLEAMPS